MILFAFPCTSKVGWMQTKKAKKKRKKCLNYEHSKNPNTSTYRSSWVGCLTMLQHAKKSHIFGFGVGNYAMIFKFNTHLDCVNFHAVYFHRVCWTNTAILQTKNYPKVWFVCEMRRKRDAPIKQHNHLTKSGFYLIKTHMKNWTLAALAICPTAYGNG